MKTSFIKKLAIGGLLGPFIFAVITFVCSSLRQDYSHTANFMSELGATGTTNAWIMNFLGFIPSGIFIIAFGFALVSSLPKKFLHLTGASLIIMFGTGLALAGIFSCDVGCPDVGTFQNNMHARIPGLAFVCAILGSLILGIAFKKTPSFNGLWLFSILSAIVSVVLLTMLISSLEPRTPTVGMWQRLMLLSVFLWIVVIGYRIYKATPQANASKFS